MTERGRIVPHNQAAELFGAAQPRYGEVHIRNRGRLLILPIDFSKTRDNLVLHPRGINTPNRTGRLAIEVEKSMSTQSPIVVSSPAALEDGAFRFLGLPTLIHASAKATNGTFGLIEHPAMHPGFATPHHVHHREDEAFYIIEGEVAFILNGEWKRVGPGAYVYGPREIPHGFKIVGEAPARMLVVCTPGGFENFMLELGQPLDGPPAPPEMPKLVAAAARAGIDILGPLPEEPV